MLPVLLQDPARHTVVTAAKALSEGDESCEDKVCSRHGQEGTKMVDHEATCRLGSGDMWPLNVELLHKLCVCVVCFAAIVYIVWLCSPSCVTALSSQPTPLPLCSVTVP